MSEGGLASTPPPGSGGLLIYRDGGTNLQVRIDGQTVWLTQAQMAELYQTTPQNITLHLQAIYDEGEASEEATCKEFLQVRQEGNRQVKRLLRYYNLDAILAVGYRVRSPRGTLFRQWATMRLRELLVKGFTLDDERIKAGRTLGANYFDELLARIRDIRTSERLFYQKITDIYATSIDYDASAELTQLFFQTVQNKMHWAAHGHTAAEVVQGRADAAQPNMGLTTWKNAPTGPVRKADVAIAKNYLTREELESLNLIVSAYLDFAEIQARSHRPMHMADWIAKLDDFLRLSHGGSTKTRIPPEEFERQRIPLPPLPAQRQIVGAWEAARKSAAVTAAKIGQLEHEIEARFLADLGLKAPAQATVPKAFALWWSELERWSVMFNQLASVAIDISGGKYSVATLGKVATVSYGIQKCPANRPGRHPRPYLRVANVQRGELDLREIKYIDVPDADMPSLRLDFGDLLVCEGNSADLVGRPAIWHGQIEDCVHQNHILKVRVDRMQAMPEYVLEYMHSAPARNHFRARAKFTTNLASINSNDLRELSLPPLSVQRQIVERVAKRREEIARLKADAKTSADAAKADVEAMILGTKPIE